MMETIGIAYDLPFEVRYSPGRVFSCGGDVSIFVNVLEPSTNMNILAEIVRMFAALGKTGALSGAEIEPWKSELMLSEASSAAARSNRFDFSYCLADERALSVLLQLLMAKRTVLALESVRISSQGRQPNIKLRQIPDLSTTLPEIFSHLPFLLIDENPESSGYTFTAELQRPLLPEQQRYLEEALRIWTTVVRAGGYEMAPIPPEESFVELVSDSVAVFDTTVEWGITKLRADPDCINGIVNIFGAFHTRCQPLLSLGIN